MTPALDHAAIEKALVDWVENATGLPRASIVFRDQKTLQANGPYCRIWINGIFKWSSVDEVRQTVSGSDVVLEHYGPRKMMVYVDFFDISNRPDGDHLAMVTKAQSSLQTLAVTDLLTAGGLVCINPGRIYTRSAEKGAEWEHAARVDVEFRITTSITETVGTIETVNVQADLSPTVDVFTESVDL